MKIDLIVGTRPGYLKTAHHYRESCKYPDRLLGRLVHNDLSGVLSVVT